jgi:solute carrier family 25 citrate transporter 1
VSGPANVIAGFGAGATESLLAVTPFESIKTQLIDDRKAAKPRMRGFLHGSRIIAQEKGIRGFFQGFVPTTARQAANSAVRFSSYTGLKQLAQSYVKPGEKLGAVSTFGIGGLAGIITVYATMPLDTVKTRYVLEPLREYEVSFGWRKYSTDTKLSMQSIEARAQYKNSFHCAARIVKEEGFFTLWSGAVPRLGRLILSGGIVFTMYEKAMEFMDKLDPHGRYI